LQTKTSTWLHPRRGSNRCPPRRWRWAGARFALHGVASVLIEPRTTVSRRDCDAPSAMKLPSLAQHSTMTWPANLDYLNPADVMQTHLTTLGPDPSIAELLAYFGATDRDDSPWFRRGDVRRVDRGGEPPPDATTELLSRTMRHAPRTIDAGPSAADVPLARTRSRSAGSPVVDGPPSARRYRRDTWQNPRRFLRIPRRKDDLCRADPVTPRTLAPWRPCARPVRDARGAPLSHAPRLTLPWVPHQPKH